MNYFQEGEEVILSSKSNTDFNGDQTVLMVIPPGQDWYINPINQRKVLFNLRKEESYSYLLDGVLTASAITGEPVYKVWAECALRKKYKGSDVGFSEMMEKFIKVTV